MHTVHTSLLKENKLKGKSVHGTTNPCGVKISYGPRCLILGWWRWSIGRRHGRSVKGRGTSRLDSVLRTNTGRTCWRLHSELWLPQTRMWSTCFLPIKSFYNRTVYDTSSRRYSTVLGVQWDLSLPSLTITLALTVNCPKEPFLSW